MHAKDLARLQALADGFRGSKGTLSLAARDYELCGGDKDFKGAKANPKSTAYVVSAPQFVAAVDAAVKSDARERQKQLEKTK